MKEKPFYLSQLEKTLSDRVRVNPRYSLRAFARDLEIAAPRLCSVLNQKFGLSRDSAISICEKLAYDSKTKSTFIDSVEAEHHRSPKKRALAQERLLSRKRVYNSLELDRFQVVADWYHFAIMELTKTVSFTRNDSKKIAALLGISIVETKVALERLLSLELLKTYDHGNLAVTGNYMVRTEGASEAIRRHHLQLVEKAKTSIAEQAITERMLRSLTIAISDEDYPEFSKLFSDFQKKIGKLSNRSGKKKKVYAWTMQFCPLTKPITKKEKI